MIEVVRKFYQVYVELHYISKEGLLVRAINALAPVDKIKVEPHQVVLYKGHVEVKVGLRGPLAWMQVSVVFKEDLEEIYNKIVGELEYKESKNKEGEEESKVE